MDPRGTHSGESQPPHGGNFVGAYNIKLKFTHFSLQFYFSLYQRENWIREFFFSFLYFCQSLSMFYWLQSLLTMLLLTIAANFISSPVTRSLQFCFLGFVDSVHQVWMEFSDAHTLMCLLELALVWFHSVHILMHWPLLPMLSSTLRIFPSGT